jgi:uncharacterized protein YjdB
MIASSAVVALSSCGPPVVDLTMTPPNMMIIVDADTADLDRGDEQFFKATATYSDGTTEDVTSHATWTSSDPTIATVGDTGLAGAHGEGSTTITATYGGMTRTANLSVSYVWTCDGVPH